MKLFIQAAFLTLALTSSLAMAKDYDNSKPGWRNPGGVGRYKEYYPAGDKFQNPGGPSQAARFDSFDTRGQQMRAQEIGIQRYNSYLRQREYNQPRFFYFYGFR